VPLDPLGPDDAAPVPPEEGLGPAPLLEQEAIA
jgi:hypothetical protein